MSASVRTKSKSKSEKDKAERVVGGRKAVNPHFSIDQAVFDAARERAAARGLSVGEVVRRGLEEYAHGAPEQGDGRMGLLPAEAMQHVEALWRSGDKGRLNGYFAALAQAGWPLRMIADSMVDAGLVPSMSRQAVYERVAKVNEAPADLPPVPVLPLRRVQPVASPYDFSLRVAQEVYDEAVGRAKAEGAHMSAVVQDVVERFLRGEFDEGLDGPAEAETTPPADAVAKVPAPVGAAAAPAGRRSGVAVKRARPSVR
jgi:hypothetical protein